MSSCYIPVKTNNDELTFQENGKLYLNLNYYSKSSSGSPPTSDRMAKFIQEYSLLVSEKKHDIKCENLYNMYCETCENPETKNKFGRYVKGLSHIKRFRKGQATAREYYYRFLTDKKEPEKKKKKEKPRMKLSDFESDSEDEPPVKTASLKVSF